MKLTNTYPVNITSGYFALLQIGLAVEVLGVYITKAVLVGGPQDQDVGRDHLVAGEVHHVPHLHVLPQSFDITTTTATKEGGMNYLFSF